VRLDNDPRVFAPNGYTWALCDGLKDASLPEPTAILDVGTGGGVLAVWAGLTWPFAAIEAIDVDPRATDLARANLAANGLGEPRSRVEEVTIAEFTPTVEPDLILANLPQLPAGWHDDRYVSSGDDGLEAIGQTMAWTARHAAPGGRLYLTLADFLDKRRLVDLASDLRLDLEVLLHRPVRPGPATRQRRPWLEQHGYRMRTDENGPYVDVMTIEVRRAAG